LLFAALLGVVLALSPAVGPAPPPAATPATAATVPLDLVYLGEGQTRRLRVDVELDGQPLETFWDETFRRLFSDLDRDGNGFLSREDVRRAPSALRVRQLT
jgi:hypothetical protein